MRATNLQELVYKQGQAGVTKATVSITWHNNDPKTGPAGYEEKEYITITRQVAVLTSDPMHAWRMQANIVPLAASLGLQSRHSHACPLLTAIQVVIGGRNKYLINGHAAQEKWVAHPTAHTTTDGVAQQGA